MSLAKKLKSIIKGEEKPTFGTNPLDPWSTKAGITESEASMLARYLNSRGINPQFVSKDTKISHAKSAEFAKWKNDHMFDDPADTLSSVMADKLRTQKSKLKEAVDKKDTVTMDIPLLIRVLELSREDIKSDMDLHRVVEKLINIRKKGVLTMKDYNYVAKIKESLETGNLQEIYRDPTPLDHETVKRHLHNIMGIPHDENEPSATPAVHRAIKKVSTAGTSSTKRRSKEILHSLIQKHHIPIDAEHRALLNKEETELEEGAFKRIATDREEDERLSKMSALDKFRADATAREKKHAEIAKKSGGMTAAIDRLEKHINKEEVEQIDELTKSDYISAVRKTKDPSFSDDEHGPGYKSGRERIINRAEKHQGKKFADKLRKDNYWREFGLHKGVRKGMKKIGNDGKSHPITPDTYKEEVEQIDELKKSTVFSWLKQQPVVPKKKDGMTRKAHNQRIKTHTKSWNRALDRLSGYKPTSENTLDSLAATEAPCDCANGGETTSIKKKEMSKSARIIKNLYKKKGMKESAEGQSGGGIMYDQEKTDKSEVTYGKKPKVQKQDLQKSFGDNKPQAAAVLSGGKTLTGQTRDTLEIDPMMRKPSTPDGKKLDK